MDWEVSIVQELPDIDLDLGTLQYSVVETGQ
jgi:hypothetical protein